MIVLILFFTCVGVTLGNLKVDTRDGSHDMSPEEIDFLLKMLVIAKKAQYKKDGLTTTHSDATWFVCTYGDPPGIICHVL